MINNPPRDKNGRFIKGYHYNIEGERKAGTTHGFQVGNKLGLGNKVNLGRKHSEEWKENASNRMTCRWEAFRTERNTTKNEYTHYKTSEYKRWRLDVFTRDNYTCRSCGNKSGLDGIVYLHPHHLFSYTEYKNLRYDKRNGITLCIECHKRVHRKAKKGDCILAS